MYYMYMYMRILYFILLINVVDKKTPVNISGAVGVASWSAISMCTAQNSGTDNVSSTLWSHFLLLLFIL
jgi:hypothetical protein